MLTREDLPPDMPPEQAERLLTIAAKGRWPSNIPVYLMYFVFALIVFGAAQKYFDIAPLAWGLMIPAIYGMQRVEQFFRARDVQKLLVQFGRTCPKCQQPIHSDTWSMSKGKSERDALLQGYCPRCFDRIAITKG